MGITDQGAGTSLKEVTQRAIPMVLTKKPVTIARMMTGTRFQMLRVGAVVLVCFMVVRFFETNVGANPPRIDRNREVVLIDL